MDLGPLQAVLHYLEELQQDWILEVICFVDGAEFLQLGLMLDEE